MPFSLHSTVHVCHTYIHIQCYNLFTPPPPGFIQCGSSKALLQYIHNKPTVKIHTHIYIYIYALYRSVLNSHFIDKVGYSTIEKSLIGVPSYICTVGFRCSSVGSSCHSTLLCRHPQVGRRANSFVVVCNKS